MQYTLHVMQNDILWITDTINIYIKFNIHDMQNDIINWLVE